MDAMEKTVKTWLAARKVIGDFLGELVPHMSPTHREHNAAAVIARLAASDPPLLVCTMDEMKE